MDEHVINSFLRSGIKSRILPRDNSTLPTGKCCLRSLKKKYDKGNKFSFSDIGNGFKSKGVLSRYNENALQRFKSL